MYCGRNCIIDAPHGILKTFDLFSTFKKYRFLGPLQKFRSTDRTQYAAFDWVNPMLLWRKCQPVISPFSRKFNFTWMIGPTLCRKCHLSFDVILAYKGDTFCNAHHTFKYNKILKFTLNCGLNSYKEILQLITQSVGQSVFAHRNKDK